MDLEEDATIFFRISADFPREDVEAIAARLAGSNSLIPGFIAPPAGLVSIEALLYAELIDRSSTVVLLDRNVASRMAKIAKEGVRRPLDGPSQVAVDLMALSQSMNLDLEPVIAFRELAHAHGNEAAIEELQWFRSADVGQARAWIDVALGRADALPSTPPADREEYNLAQPFHRWRCNYVVLLKAAELELSPLSPRERAERLYQWMASDFIIAGPAALYSSMFFSPFAAKAGLFKQLRSRDRQRALTGIRNAAWDVTYLSDLSRRAMTEPYESKRFLLATADRALAEIAPLLFLDAEDMAGFEIALAARVESWWRGDAAAVARFATDAMAEAESRPPPEGPEGVEDYVGYLIGLGEQKILDG